MKNFCACGPILPVILSALLIPAAATIVATALFSSSCTPKTTTKTEDLTRWVDQTIGTGGHGHVFMGASVPFGAVQLGPTSIPQGWDWTSGYHQSDSTVIGFAHTHLSGTGIGDLSDIVLMPTTGKTAHGRGNPKTGYESGQWSYFSRENEFCAPGYYATRLDRWGIEVELTATERVGFHKYTFPADASDTRVLFDLENGQGWDEPTEGMLRAAPDGTIEGYRYSKGWANDQRIYFVAEFSRPFRSFTVYDKDTPQRGGSFAGKRVYGEALFGNAPTANPIGTQGGTTVSEPLYVKVAISPVSIANARENLETELVGWDFGATIATAKSRWNAELGKIRIHTDDDALRRTFYTALYHTMIAPSLFCDINSETRLAADSVSGAANASGDQNTASIQADRPHLDYNTYTTFSLWDTYRAAHPLMTIIHPEKVPDMINSMLAIYRAQGKLPVWHLMGCETDCMVGNPAIPVVADAILKGFGGFDREAAYEAMRTSAMLDERGMDLYKEYGYIPFDKYNESVATTLEYALADWALAQVAREDGHTEDAAYFDARSKAYKHFFDPETGFLRGRSSTGRLREPFDPFRSTHRGDDYTEGNAWQYTWLVPHDVEGLVEQFGGRERFHAKLDSLFVVSGDLGADASPDISGLIGQYAHGNEPGHHIIYMYAMTGRQHRTAELVRRVMREMYRDAPDGLSGNEDVGQMSAWYVLSALGFYQVEPAGGRYFFGSPLFDSADVAVGSGRVFRIRAIGNSPQNIYIQSVTLNGRALDRPWVEFSEIAAGGELIFTMGPTPADI